MNEFGITEKSYGLILEAFYKYADIEEVLVFGSRAMGNYKTGSDIDFAIKGRNINNKTACDVSGYLNEVLPIPYYIDVVCYEALINAELKKHIDRHGKLCYRRQEILSTTQKANKN